MVSKMRAGIGAILLVCTTVVQHPVTHHVVHATGDWIVFAIISGAVTRAGIEVRSH